MQTSIDWNEAVQQSTANQQRNEQTESDYMQNLDTAKTEVWEHLANAPLSCTDFEDYALMNGVEIDDLFESFI